MRAGGLRHAAARILSANSARVSRAASVEDDDGADASQSQDETPKDAPFKYPNTPPRSRRRIFYNPAMRRSTALFAALISCAAAALAAPPAPFVATTWRDGELRASELRAGDEAGSASLLLRGVAVPDPILHDFPARGILPGRLPGLLKSLFNANALRIAVHPGSIRPSRAGPVDPERLSQVWRFIDEVSAAASEAGMYAIIDFHAIGHPGGGLSTGELFDATPEMALEFWGQAARRYRDKPEVIFELFNEPFGSPVAGNASRLRQQTLEAYYKTLLAALIAEGSRSNLVILSGLEFSSDLSGFGRRPLTEVVVWEDSPQEAAVPVDRRIAYGVHFYPSRPNAGGPEADPGQTLAAMRAAIPPNLAVIVTEFGFDAGTSQKEVLALLGRLGAMPPQDFLGRLAAQARFFDPARLPEVLELFDFRVPGRAAEFARRMYDGRLIADIHAALTPEGVSAVAAGGLAAIVRRPEAGSPEDRALLQVLSRMPFSLELADRPGFREAVSSVAAAGGGAVAWAFADWGGLVEAGRMGEGMTEADLTEYGRFLRRLFDGARY